MNRKQAFKTAARALHKEEFRIKSDNWVQEILSDESASLNSSEDYYNYLMSKRFDILKKLSKNFPSSPTRNDVSAMNQMVMSNLGGTVQYLDQIDDQFVELDKEVAKAAVEIKKEINKYAPDLSPADVDDLLSAIIAGVINQRDLPRVGPDSSGDGVMPMINDLQKIIRLSQNDVRDIIRKANY